MTRRLVFTFNLHTFPFDKLEKKEEKKEKKKKKKNGAP
jgi:phage protein U